MTQFAIRGLTHPAEAHPLLSRAAPRVAGYTLSRPLGGFRLGHRWLAHASPSGEAAVACRIGGTGSDINRRAAREVVGRLGRLEHRHIVRVLATAIDAEGDPWIVTEYTGTHDGLTTLPSLVALKGGRLSPYETRLVIEQLLSAIAYAHERGETHGELSIDDVLVDRRGSVLIELYGVHRRIAAPDMDDDEARRAEVRSLATIACELLTGLPGDEGLRVRGALRRAGRSWKAWIEKGLAPESAWAGAGEALASVPLR